MVPAQPDRTLDSFMSGTSALSSALGHPRALADAADGSDVISQRLPLAQRVPIELLEAIFALCSLSSSKRRRSAPPIARIALVCKAWLEVRA